MRTFSVVNILVASGVGFAQSAVDVPRLGWVYDSENRALRPLSGIPMSAELGTALDGRFSLAVGSPDGSFALTVSAAGGQTVIVTSSGEATVEAARTNPSRLVISPQGRAAALYFDDSNLVQLFAGLPGSPRLTREINIDFAPGVLAVDDSGSTLAASSDAGLFVFREEQGKQLAMAAAVVRSASFLAGKSHLIAATGDTVDLLEDGVLTEWTRDNGVDQPLAALASSDGQTIAILNTQSRINVYDRKAATSVTLTCVCKATTLTAVRGNAVFRINGLEDGTLWLLNAGDPEPKLTFVATRGEQ